MNILTVGQKAAKAQAIAKIAAQQFATQSFGQITMAGIAKQAGVSKGTLFNYFESKESLFMTLLLDGNCDYFDQVSQTIAARSVFTLTDFLKLLLDETAALITSHAELVRLNALRGPILEQGANLKQTVTHRQALYAANERLAQQVCDRIPSLTVTEVSQLLLVQSAVISGLMNLSGLDEFQKQPLVAVDFENFKVDLKQDAVATFKYYLLGRYPQVQLEEV